MSIVGSAHQLGTESDLLHGQSTQREGQPRPYA